MVSHVRTNCHVVMAGRAVKVFFGVRAVFNVNGHISDVTEKFVKASAGRVGELPYMLNWCFICFLRVRRKDNFIASIKYYHK